MFRNSRCAAWAPRESKRFKEPLKHLLAMPEPATYHPSDMHSHDDSYILSTTRTYKAKRFVPIPKTQQSAKRSCKLDLIDQLFLACTPGPGAYLLPSEFGTVITPPLLDMRRKRADTSQQEQRSKTPKSQRQSSRLAQNFSELQPASPS